LPLKEQGKGKRNGQKDDDDWRDGTEEGGKEGNGFVPYIRN